MKYDTAAIITQQLTKAALIRLKINKLHNAKLLTAVLYLMGGGGDVG